MKFKSIDKIPEIKIPEDWKDNLEYFFGCGDDPKSPPYLFLMPDKKIKEGFAQLVWSHEKQAVRTTFWLANNSCSCCYEELSKEELPTHFAPMPTAETIEIEE